MSALATGRKQTSPRTDNLRDCLVELDGQLAEARAALGTIPAEYHSLDPGIRELERQREAVGEQLAAAEAAEREEVVADLQAEGEAHREAALAAWRSIAFAFEQLVDAWDDLKSAETALGAVRRQARDAGAGHAVAAELASPIQPLPRNVERLVLRLVGVSVRPTAHERDNDQLRKLVPDLTPRAATEHLFFADTWVF